MSNLLKPLLLGGLAAAMLASTACTGQSRIAVRGEVRTADPHLAYVGDDVWVVTDYHDPVFYTDGYYWRYDGGYWFRSHVHYGDWRPVHRAYVPRHVTRIDRPGRYIRYRAHGDVRVRRGPPPGDIRVRDHRTNRRYRDYDDDDRRRYRY